MGDSVAQDQSAWLDHSGVNSLLRVGIGEHIPPESVATPYGLGTVQSVGDSVTVSMNWCTAHLAPSCVQRSRTEVLEETLLSLNSTLGVYVDALPPLTGCERPGATRTSSFFAVSRPRPGRPLSRRGSGVSRDASPATPGTGRHSKENVPRDFTVLDAARKIKDIAGCGFLTQDSPSNRRSLSNGFEPKIVGTPRKNTESPRISKEMADCTVAPPSIPANVEEAVSRMSHVRTLMSWLEEAARQPVLEHHEELPEIAVLLSGIVRSRTELAQLRHLDSDPQLHAERLVADAVRIHLGLLERHKPRPARPRQDHWGPSCHKWRAVLQKLIATGETYDGDSGHTSGHGTPSCPPDGKLIWPGASRVDVEESIEACNSSFETPSSSSFFAHSRAQRGTDVVPASADHSRFEPCACEPRASAGAAGIHTSSVEFGATSCGASFHSGGSVPAIEPDHLGDAAPQFSSAFAMSELAGRSALVPLRRRDRFCRARRLLTLASFFEFTLAGFQDLLATSQ